MTRPVVASSSTADTSANEPQKAAEATPIQAQLMQLRALTEAMVSAGNTEKAIGTLLDIICHQHHDIARLTQYSDALKRILYSRRSEKLTLEELGQLALAFGATAEDAAQSEPVVPGPMPPEEDAAAPKPSGKNKQKRQHPGRSKLDSALPRRIMRHLVPDAERACMHCSQAMQTIGYVDYECVQYHPARIEVDVDRCEKIACTKCQQDIVTAPRPNARTGKSLGPTASATARPAHGTADATALRQDEATPADSTPTTPATRTADAAARDEDAATAPGAHVYRRAGASLLAHLLEAKADDALPIYRQRQQLARLGFDAPLNTLYSYWDAAAAIVQPVAQIVLAEVLGHDIVGLDDTRLDWLDPNNKRRRKRGHLWCFMGIGPLVAFDFTESWCAEEVAPWIHSIPGFIQCDDYGGYSALLPHPDGTRRPLVPREQRLGCWMHVRRPFHKAFKAGEKHAIIALGHIKDLYAIESEAREATLAPAERLALRQRRSQPIADAFFAWVEQQKAVVRPASYLGKALTYAIDQKEFVLRCLTDGRFELDTGRVERQIREPVIGRKNYLFAGSSEAAKRLAGVYTLVCSCQNLRISTYAYLVDIITRLQAGFPLRHINRLRPDIWAQEHPSLTAHQMAQKPAQQTVSPTN